MNNIKMKYNNYFLEVDLNGGRIKELRFKDKIILGTYERNDGKVGNTHICCPNFAAEGVEKYGFMFHGPFRNSIWTKFTPDFSFDKNGSLIIYNEIDGLKVIQKFLINDNFEHEIIIKNISKQPKRVNVGLHNYFDTEFGWKGLKINGTDVSKIVEISDYVKLNKINEIKILGKESIIWKTDGFAYAKLWSCSGDEKYVCIEPIIEKEGFVEMEESFLESGRELVLRQVFGVVYRT